MNNNISATQLSLPKGGGAIRGIGETFQANEFTGTASLTIPIPTSPCRGFEPHLSLDYSSGSGNGVFGLAFDLAIPSISRKTAKGIPKYDTSDVFLLSQAEDLVPLDNGTREERQGKTLYAITAYRPRLEGLFAQIEHWVEKEKPGESHWRVLSKNNVTSIFGKTAASQSADPKITPPRIAAPDNSGHIFKWLLSETFDAQGNRAVYEYLEENDQGLADVLCEKNRSQTANRYLKRIKYGNTQPYKTGEQAAEDNWHFEVVFDYGEHQLPPDGSNPYLPEQAWKKRQDSHSTYHAGFEIRTHRLCQNILMFHRFTEIDASGKPILVQATRFHYRESPGLTLLASVEHTGYEQGVYRTKSLPPLEFGYTAFDPNGHRFEPLLENAKSALPGLDLEPDYRLVDLYGEGIPGILYSDGSTVRYWEPKKPDGAGTGLHYGSPGTPATLPIESQRLKINPLLMDLTGNGQLDLVVSRPAASGYYQVQPDRSWSNFQTFPAFPSDFHSPHHHLVDVTGDGLADVVLIERDQISFYPSLGENGFGAAQYQKNTDALPAPKQDSATEVWQFADLLGSGTQHLIHIGNGKVECWPSLGYGRFGKSVQLENAPRFGTELDASRLFLADVDGSGTLDLIYLYPDRIDIYFNYSGNAFSTTPTCINLPGTWDRLNQIRFADVYGNGTTCLIFSENHPQPRHWCYDFCKRQKPYLLDGIDNNLGAKTTLSYRSSTRYYLEDKEQGKPWIGNLPFPVQVVAQIKNEDQVSGTALVSTFSYHHGCYDGVEREFRGFGLVERQDAETLPTDAKATDVAPVLSKTWYHTGVPQADGSLSRQFAHDYFQGDALAHTFPDSVFDPPDTKLDAETRRQALRALKGAVLRQEVYAPTAPAAMPGQKQDAPYAVTEHNYLVKLLQTQGQNPNAVLFVHPQETVSYDYERNPNDPRIHHQFTLGVDEYGNMLRSCDIAYGRRKDEKIPEQNSLKMTVQENNFINKAVPGIRLLGIPRESKHYEITNPPLPVHNYFSFSELSEFLLWLNSPGLREVLNKKLNHAESSLLLWQRYYYWDTTACKPYALGEIDAQALLANVETAEFSDAQIKTAFTGAQTEVELASKLQAQGRYRPDQGYWWNPGLSESYEGASKFFLPKATIDAFNHATCYAYDAYCLLPVKVTDALDNETKIEKIDYQTLQAQKTSDINGNISELLFDPLGLVTVWSEYKPLDDHKISGFLPLEPYPTKDSTNKTYVPKNPTAHRVPIAGIVAHPEDYLQGAKTYFYYDLFSWKNRRTPVHTVSLVPENYPGTDGKNTGAIQIHIDYSDGFGRAVQSTTKVEPGKAHTLSGDTITPDRETAERWLTSGRTVYNNKGLPVKQYEPYYIDTWSYIDNPLLNKFGVSPTLHYDPLGRLIRTDTPKGFFSKVEFSPWLESHFDENDTVKDSDYYQKHNADTAETFKWERDALKKAAEFYDTPHETVLDNLGRVVQDIQINVRKIDNTEVKEKYRLISHYRWDIQGNQTASADPRLAQSGKNNFETLYSMTGAPLKTISADAGPRWLLHNVMGGPIYARDARGFETVTRYDALHRPVEVSVESEMKPKQVVERIVYGDNLNAEQKLQLPDPKKSNLRGQPYLHYDQAGLVSFPHYNCMGLPLKIIRQLRMDYQQEANWPSLTGTVNPPAGQGGSDGQVKPLRNVHEITGAFYSPHPSPLQQERGQIVGVISSAFLTCDVLLEEQSYRTTYQYDALGRVTQETNPDGNVTVPSYHLSGHIDQIRVDGKAYVKGTVYNAKGQRLSITYGNDVITRYEYETETFRLRRIDTTRLKGSEQLQDLHYSYDPVGNITHISDRLQDVVIHDNQKAHPESDYSYDALYRLVTAIGREHPALSETRQQRHGDFQGFSLPQVGDGQVLKKYRQNFSYDDGGNLYHVQHIGKNPWTQQLTVSGNSNRAVNTELADTPAKVNDAFDANGNQVKLPGLAGIAWNYRDNIACATVIDRSAEKKHSDAEYYVYDGGGSRIRKVTERYANDNTTLNIEETIYLGNLEIKRSLSKPVAANSPGTDLPPRPQGISIYTTFRKLWHDAA